MPAKERHGLDGDIEKTCENCRYFSGGGQSGDGDCRRHAPQPSSVRIRRHGRDETVALDSWWPTVSDGDWCGDFEEIDATDW
jgi:hypothetical protein